MRKERDLGQLGEQVLGVWAAQDGLTANKATIDKEGWDFILQFERRNASNLPLTLDLTPAQITCLVQVKATEHGNPPDVTLNNWRKLAFSQLPAFFLVMNFDAQETPTKSWLIHIDEKLITNLLNRLRKLSTGDINQLNRKTMRVPLLDKSILSPQSGAGLRSTIEDTVGPDDLAYHDRKSRLVKTVGYPDRPTSITFVTLPAGGKTADELMAEHSLGLTPTLPSILKEHTITRFNISTPVDLSLPKDITVHINPPIKHAHLVFRSPNNTGHCAQLDATLYHSHSIFPFLRDELRTIRLIGNYFDIRICGSSKVQYIFNMPEPADEVRLRDLGEVCTLMRMILNQASIQATIALEDGITKSFSLNCNNSTTEPLRDFENLAAAVADAYAISRVLNLDENTMVSTGHLISFREDLAGMVGLFIPSQNNTPFIIDGTIASDKERPELVGTPLVLGAFLGKTLVMAGAALSGKPNYDLRNADDVVPFRVLCSAPNLVAKEVIPNASTGTYSTKALFDKASEWLRSMGILVLPQQAQQEATAPDTQQ